MQHTVDNPTTSKQKQPPIADRAAALERIVENYLTLRLEALSGLGGIGKLAELAIRPHIAEQISSGDHPAWAKSKEGKMLFSNAVVSNILLGFIEPSRREEVIGDRHHPALNQSIGGRIFDLADFADSVASGRLLISYSVEAAFRKLPKAEHHGKYYRSVLSHGDTPQTPLGDRDWNAIVHDSCNAARAAKSFLNTELHVIAARHERIAPEDGDSRKLAAALRRVVNFLPEDREKFNKECVRIGCDERMMAQLRYWSAAEQAHANQGQSSSAQSNGIFRRMVQAMDNLQLVRDPAVEYLTGLRLSGA